MKPSAFLLSIFFLLEAAAFAADPSVVRDLPYGTRTLEYSAYSGTTRGDIRTVGMAGATLGLGDTFAAAGDNPAGLAMTMNVGDTHVSSNQISDSQLQSAESLISAASVGAALQASDWGVSVGSLNTWGEGQFYRIPKTGGVLRHPRYVDLYVRETRIGFAKRMDHDRLSLGVQLRWGRLRQSLGSGANEFENLGEITSALGVTLGVLYKLPARFLLGAALSGPMRYEPTSTGSEFSELPGLLKAAQAPLKGGVGLGFIPNRIFRSDLSLHFVDVTPDTALLADESRKTGTHMTLEPRLGAAYVFGDFRSMRATAFAGAYLEPSRITGFDSRFHGTGGLELKWSFVNFGVGFDFARGYHNRLASIGIDPFTVMEKLAIIPRPPIRQTKGFLPGVRYVSDEGLPQALQVATRSKSSESSEEPGLNPIQIGIDIPRKLGEKVRKLRPGQVIDTIKELPGDIGGDLQEVGREIDKKFKLSP